MVLQKIEERKSYILMTWECRFKMQWPNILFATKSILNLFQDPSVMAGDPGTTPYQVNPSDRPEEKSMLRIKGYSKTFKGNMSMVFYNQTSNVTIYIPKSMCIPSDYESLSKAIGPFMDIVELYMYKAK